jgi:hypothetical protein
MDLSSLGNVVLGASIIAVIAGISMAFSKKERERVQKRVMAELPDRSAVTGSPEAMRIVQRRGYITLVAGIISFIIWVSFFWFQSLSTI